MRCVNPIDQAILADYWLAAYWRVEYWPAPYWLRGG